MEGRHSIKNTGYKEWKDAKIERIWTGQMSKEAECLDSKLLQKEQRITDSRLYKKLENRT